MNSADNNDQLPTDEHAANDQKMGELAFTEIERLRLLNVFSLYEAVQHEDFAEAERILELGAVKAGDEHSIALLRIAQRNSQSAMLELLDRYLNG